MNIFKLLLIFKKVYSLFNERTDEVSDIKLYLRYFAVFK